MTKIVCAGCDKTLSGPLGLTNFIHQEMDGKSYCEKCARERKWKLKPMLLTEEEKRKIEEEERYRVKIRVELELKHQNTPSLNAAYVLNLLLPGVGHIYLGNVGGGIVMFLIALCGLSTAGFLTIIVWVYALVTTKRVYKELHEDSRTVYGYCECGGSLGRPYRKSFSTAKWSKCRGCGKEVRQS